MRMELRPKYKIIISDEVNDFLSSLPSKVRDKIIFNANLVSLGKMDKDLFKKLEGSEIWELRTLFSGMSYRILAFWDTRKGALILTTHGFIKKSNKTPKKEIDKAEKIRKEYFIENER